MPKYLICGHSSHVIPLTETIPYLSHPRARNFARHQQLRSAVIMRDWRVFTCSPQILLFLTFLCAGNLLHLKKCLTKVFCLSPWNDGKCLAYGDVPILCSALIKRLGSGNRLGFKLTLNCRRHFFSRRITYHCNLTVSFQLDNLALCGDVHPNPGHGNTSDKAGAFAGRKHPTWKRPLQTSPLKPKGHSL